MKKYILIVIAIVIATFTLQQQAVAGGQSISSVINKQSKQIKNLSSRVENLENTIYDLKIIIADLKKNKTSNSSSLNDVAIKDSDLANDDNNLAEPEKMLDAEKDKRDYDLALALLKSGKFMAAESKFSLFIRDYPESPLQSNAIFWYSESFYHRNIYNKAAINYLKGYKKYPKGAKAADSLLKLSFALNALNKNKEACNILGKLDEEFPNRPATSIKRAKNAKSKFGCGA